MKKAFFFVALSLMLQMTLMQPAAASSQSVIVNETPYTVKGTITYHEPWLCKDTHLTIAPAATFRTGSTSCLMHNVNFSADGHRCELIAERSRTPTAFFVFTGRSISKKDLYCGFISR